MFNLDNAISDWRQKMSSSGINSPAILDELEGHLRDDFSRQTKSGSDESKAFDSAVQRIGDPNAIKTEFLKVNTKSWNRPLAMTAWTIYVVSFFVPAFMEGWGFQCAILQNHFWDQAMHGEWPAINYELLTLANILMLASPFLLLRAGLTIGSVRWFRGLTLVATALVWSFLGLLLSENAHEMKVGAYMWGSSFVLIHLASYVRPTVKVRYA